MNARAPMLWSDVTLVMGAPINSPCFTGQPRAPTPHSYDQSNRIATTEFVQQNALLTIGALLASPALTGTPTAPTPPWGTSNTQLATTQFVMQAIAGSVAGVNSFAGRQGDVQLLLADIVGAGGAPINSPQFTGTPTIIGALAPSDNSNAIPTTAWLSTSTLVSNLNGDIADLHTEVTSIQNRGLFVGSFATFALVPLNTSGFPGAVTVNDFVNVVADETHGGATTRYVATAIAGDGTITWSYDMTYSTDISGKMDTVPSAVSGNLAAYGAAGQVVDAGVTAASKMNTVPAAAVGNLATFAAGGQVQDGGALSGSLAGLMQAVTPAPVIGSLASFAASGQLQGSTIPATNVLVFRGRISGGTDLNDYVTPSIWAIGSYGEWLALANKPPTANQTQQVGTLTVEAGNDYAGAGGSNNLTQTLAIGMATNDPRYPARVFTRQMYYTAGAQNWMDWVELTPSSIVAPIDVTNQTGDLNDFMSQGGYQKIHYWHYRTGAASSWDNMPAGLPAIPGTVGWLLQYEQTSGNGANVISALASGKQVLHVGASGGVRREFQRWFTSATTPQWSSWIEIGSSTSPQLWPTNGAEQALGDGLYGRRFIGNIVAAAGVDVGTVLTSAINVNTANPHQWGGWFGAGEAASLNKIFIGAAPTGAYTACAHLHLYPGGMGMQTIHQTARAAGTGPYDVWVRYTKV